MIWDTLTLMMQWCCIKYLLLTELARIEFEHLYRDIKGVWSGPEWLCDLWPKSLSTKAPNLLLFYHCIMYIGIWQHANGKHYYRSTVFSTVLASTECCWMAVLNSIEWCWMTLPKLVWITILTDANCGISVHSKIKSLMSKCEFWCWSAL